MPAMERLAWSTFELQGDTVLKPSANGWGGTYLPPGRQAQAQPEVKVCGRRKGVLWGWHLMPASRHHDACQPHDDARALHTRDELGDINSQQRAKITK